MRRLGAVLLLLALVAWPVSGQVAEELESNTVTVIERTSEPGWRYPTGGVLVDTGPLINSPGTGAGGADESLVQNNTLGMTTLGIRNAVSQGDRASDQFTIPDGEEWQIDTCTFFAYQTGSTTTSTITAVNLQIWDGSPADVGSLVVFGDNVTNRMASTAWADIYRAAESTSGDATRPIMANVVTVGTTLGPGGTYWLDWQTDGTLGSGPWAPPITINGQLNTGDGIVGSGNGATWADWLDGGTNTPQGYPFICEGAVLGGDADLEIVKTGNVIGNTLIFTITATNNGPDAATGVTVTDDLPAEVTYVSDDCGGMNVPPWTWDIGALAVDASATCNITTTLPDGFNGSITNTASGTHDQTDPDTSNDASTVGVVAGNPFVIPTLGQIGLVALLLALAGAGVMRLRRK